MEGNACYKLTTIHNFIAATGAPPIHVAVDVGVNVGEVTLLVHQIFPDARIFGFEAVEEYYRTALSNLGLIPTVTLYNRAMTAQHRFTDDLGEQVRSPAAPLTILKGLPTAGPGWGGGSMVVTEEEADSCDGTRYQRLESNVIVVTLDEFIQEQGIEEIDLLKLDCEGCEHSVLGCADVETLRRIRFIVGEYHGFGRFHRMMQQRLFRTHKVNLIGDADLGCFFAERRDSDRDGILLHDKTGMLQTRSWLMEAPSEWHLFNEIYVLPADRIWHALP
jgi:FkbM family methyltransferase